MITVFIGLQLNLFADIIASLKFLRIFAVLKTNMVPLVQLVRASDCGSECHGFESHRAPQETDSSVSFFVPISDGYGFIRSTFTNPLIS